MVICPACQGTGYREVNGEKGGCAECGGYGSDDARKRAEEDAAAFAREREKHPPSFKIGAYKPDGERKR